MTVLRKTRGLVTHPNEINKAEGSLRVADNVIIDAEDIIESRRGFTDFGDSFATDSDRSKQIFTYKDRVLRHYNNTLQYDNNGSGSFSSFSGTYSELESGLRIKGIETQGNFYFTTNEGVKKISATSSSEFTTDSGYITDSGVSKANDLEATLKFEAGGFLPPESKTAYRLVWGIKDANNVLHLGSPSARFVLTNTSTNTLTPEQFTITFSAASESDVAGKYILFSSKDSDYYLWYSNAANDTAPQTAETLGRTAIEVDVDGLGASTTDILNRTANAIAGLSTQFTVEIAGSIITVTSQESGENIVDASTGAGILNVSITVLEQGTITEGTYANATIKALIPPNIDKIDYFYQLYRTAVVTASEDISLDDLEPGDEMNLVYEDNLTSAQISAGEIEFDDITTENFRNSGLPLYTNPNTGEGITQSNDRPPVAKDINLFRNSMFYANTANLHRLQFNLLSTTAFTSGSSKFIVGNASTVREYTFVGEEEVSDIVCDSYANTDDTGYILINSANNERKYYIWFNKGSTTDPAISNREGIQISIESGDADTDVASKLSLALDLVGDFNTSISTATVTVTNIKNGFADDISMPVSLTNNWAVSVTTQGDGEDSSLNEVLLSNNASVGQAIDETARSLVKIINKDASSQVVATYLSGPNDLPGIILFENKDYTSGAFYLATNDSAIKDKFNPSLPVVQSITAISLANPTQVTVALHGYSNNSKIFIYGTNSTPALLGEYTLTFVDVNNFTVPVNVTTAGTTGSVFEATVISDNEVSPNRLYFSKVDQPEAVPIVNYLDIGARDKAIKRIIPLRDNLFVLKEDGVFIVTGSSAPIFRVRLLNTSTQITAADSAAVLNNKIFCLTTQGVVTITEGGGDLIVSRVIENKINEFANFRYNYKTICFGVSSESDRSYFLWAPTDTTDTVGTQAYRYNIFTETWTRWTISATCGVVNPANDKIYLGSGDRNYIIEERKNSDRSDYADRNFTLSIPINSINDTKIVVSSAASLAIGDVVYQTQYVTISEINRLLLKLDIDPGLDDTDYYSTLAPSPGDQLNIVLDNINAKIVADDSSGTVTSVSFSTDFATMQTEFNNMIDELNNVASDTQYKNYKQSTGTKSYEAIIESLKKDINTIYVHITLPFLVGDIEIYKGITRKIQWAPQDFGDASLLKQVASGTIIVDQNNFYSAKLGYSTDLDRTNTIYDFKGSGTGSWGLSTFGEFIWGGNGNEIPIRTLLPQSKQICRYLRVYFEHLNARENVRILGYSLDVRPISTRAYR